jgi:hypothetical protein
LKPTARSALGVGKVRCAGSAICAAFTVVSWVRVDAWGELLAGWHERPSWVEDRRAVGLIDRRKAQ